LDIEMQDLQNKCIQHLPFLGTLMIYLLQFQWIKIRKL